MGRLNKQLNPAQTGAEAEKLDSDLRKRIVGQDSAIEQVVNIYQTHLAGMSTPGRPIGNFLFLGPTGSGKTRLVEAAAASLLGDARAVIKIDCAEFQHSHEIAKLIGSPPGYLGHRETQPLLTQQKLSAAASESCDLAIVLFDEIEKAAPTLVRLLLGVLDKGTLRLGDSTLVNFERTMIFLTSNLGARDMSHELRPEFGFDSNVPRSSRAGKLDRIGMAAVRKNFSPEFINRIDAVVTYQPLDSEALTAILNQQIEDLQAHINRRLGEQAFRIEVPARSRKFLLERGASAEYGARELKRTVQRYLIQPLAVMVAGGEIRAGTEERAAGVLVRAELGPCKQKLVLRNLGQRSQVSWEEGTVEERLIN